MSEREPRDIAKTSTWAFDTIAERMGQETKPVTSMGDRTGTGFSVIEHTALTHSNTRDIVFFQDEKQVGIRGRGFEVRLDTMQPPQPAKDGVLLESTDHRVRGLFLKDGHIAIEVFPIEQLPEINALQARRNHASEASDDRVADLPEEWRTPPHSAVQDAPETSPEQPFEMPSAPEAQERQPRIKVTGFVATEPNMKPTPAGKPRVQFLVAEHPETPEGEDPLTIYHRVYTLNKTAERLQGKGIEKGKKVAVDGYVQERKRKGKNGEEETYPVIYANNVRVLYVHKPVDY